MATQQNLHSTHAIDYTIHRHATTIPRRVNRYRCTLVTAAIADREPLRIPCFHYSGSPNMDHYVRRYQQLLITLLQSRFPFISNCCANTVAQTFTSTVLVPANEAHNRPPSEDGLRAGPAAPAAVRELVVAKILEAFKEEDHRFESVHRECAMCMEAMEMRKSALEMPCTHVFHQSCLVEWLKSGSTCPLCRYQMPRQV